MSAAEWKVIVEIIESALKSAALLVGAGWAVYGFKVFLRRQTATTALRKAESETASLELAARRRAVLDLHIEHTSRRDIVGQGYIITAHVIITNAGVSSAHIVFDSNAPAFAAQRVDFGADGTAEFRENPIRFGIRRTSDPSKLARSRVVRAGGVSRLAAVVRVASPGVYALTFRVPMDKANSEAMVEAGASAARAHAWGTSTFVCVGFPPEGGVPGVV
ncbi:MAG: hypothetical protein ABI625_22130 [bacterium]